MGRYLKKTMFLVLLLHLMVSSSSGGRSPPYESEGKPPKSAYLEFKDLRLCKLFLGKTCCSASQMQTASLAVENLATCGRVFEACSDAYFSSDASKEIIVPCGASEGIICGKAYKWEANGTAFCDAVGFSVQTADDSAEEPCYGSNASEKTQNLAWFGYLKQLVWMICKVLLSVVAQAVSISRRRNQMQRLARIQRHARRF